MGDLQTSPHINNIHETGLFLQIHISLKLSQWIQVTRRALKQSNKTQAILKKIPKTKYLDSASCPGEFFQIFKEKLVESILSSRKQKRREELPIQYILRCQYYSDIQNTQRLYRKKKIKQKPQTKASTLSHATR